MALADELSNGAQPVLELRLHGGGKFCRAERQQRHANLFALSAVTTAELQGAAVHHVVGQRQMASVRS